MLDPHRSLPLLGLLFVLFLTSRVRSQDAPRLPDALEKLGRSLAIAELTAEGLERARLERGKTIIRSSHIDGIDEGLEEAVATRKRIVGSITMLLRTIAGRLDGRGAPVQDLRAFLQAEDAADLLYDRWLHDAPLGEIQKTLARAKEQEAL